MTSLIASKMDYFIVYVDTRNNSKSGPAGSLELFVPLSTLYTVKVHLAL